ncbi:MAG: helicase, partial [Candidatus Poribacteria bacterium]|nr:helicase [Candidatus Poribacteria bacterium]
PDGRFNGVIVFYEGEIRDGADTVAGKRLFAFYVPQNSAAVEPINPALIWDFQETDPISEPRSIQELEEKVGAQVRLDLDRYKQELTNERQRQVDIKRRYGIASLERLILNLDSELLDLAIKNENGEDVKRLVQNKTEQKDRYEDEKRKLEQSCQREVTLVRKPPVFTGAIRVRPAMEGNETETSMLNRLEIERIGMEHA